MTADARPAQPAGAVPPPASPPPAGRLARHTGWNLVGVLLPLAVGLLTIPVLTRELGPVRFGLLGIAWALLEYLFVADAGLSRAVVHHVARRLRAGAPVDGEVIGAALLAQAALGSLAALLVALAAPWLVERVLDLPAALHAEARDTVRILVLVTPFALVALALRGVLEAAERFDVATALRVPASAATFVVPAVAVLLGATLPQIMAALLAVRVLTCAASWVVVRRVLPDVRPAWPRSWAPLRGLVAFGGWIALSNLLSPVFLLFDRLALGALAGAAAVGFYTAPYEAAARLLVLPAALVAAFFPRASAVAGTADRGALAALFGVALRPLLALLVPLTLAGAILAGPLLHAWLGAEYAERGVVALRLLLAGVAVNALAHVPSAFLQAAGRPEIGARFHVAELAVHVPVTIVLVSRWGATGAAAAWALRATLDAALLFAASRRVLGVGVGAGLAAGRWWRYALLLGGLAVALLGVRGAVDAGWSLALAAVATVVTGAAALAVGWRIVLADDDRLALRAALRRG